LDALSPTLGVDPSRPMELSLSRPSVRTLLEEQRSRADSAQRNVAFGASLGSPGPGGVFAGSPDRSTRPPLPAALMAARTLGAFECGGGYSPLPFGEAGFRRRGCPVGENERSGSAGAPRRSASSSLAQRPRLPALATAKQQPRRPSSCSFAVGGATPPPAFLRGQQTSPTFLPGRPLSSLASEQATSGARPSSASSLPSSTDFSREADYYGPSSPTCSSPCLKEPGKSILRAPSTSSDRSPAQLHKRVSFSLECKAGPPASMTDLLNLIRPTPDEGDSDGDDVAGSAAGGPQSKSGATLLLSCRRQALAHPYLASPTVPSPLSTRKHHQA